VDEIVALSMAGLLAVASVTERLAREYLNDGKLTMEEINDAFSPLSKNYDGLPSPSPDEEGKSKSKSPK
jgi:hypothetical protein